MTINSWSSRKDRNCWITSRVNNEKEWSLKPNGFYFEKASFKYLQFVQKHLKVSRTLHCKFNLKAHTWNINISSWKTEMVTLVPKKRCRFSMTDVILQSPYSEKPVLLTWQRHVTCKFLINVFKKLCMCLLFLMLRNKKKKIQILMSVIQMKLEHGN